MATEALPFPTNPEDFLDDERISFAKAADTYILEDEEGQEWEWSPMKNHWVKVVDQAQMDHEQELKEFLDAAGQESAATLDAVKKRKAESPPAAPAQATSKKQKAQQPRESTAIYIENLPLDVTVKEMKEEFSRYGVIAESLKDDTPRIKLYTDEYGHQNGTGLVVYFRPESVKMAILHADGWDFRPGNPVPDGPLRISVADNSFKSHKNIESVEDDGQSPAVRKKDKQRIIKKNEAMNRRLADWDDDDPQVLQQTSSRWDKVVILKNMFTLKELEEDAAAILDIKTDMREECEKFGPVSNVVLYDKEPDGVITVRFSNAESARACVNALSKRKYSGVAVKAYISTGDESFKKSSKSEEPEADESRIKSAISD